MNQNRGKRAMALLGIVAFVASGCMSGIVKREELETTTKLAVVSVVMPRADYDARKANSAVLQEMVDRAAEKTQSGLRSIRNWKVLNPSESKAGKAVLSSFGAATRADLAAVFPQPAEQEHAKEAISTELAGWKTQFIGARGLLVVPREALLPDEELTQKDETVRPLMRHLAGKLCKELLVDAVAFVHVRYTVTHPRESAFIVTDDRTDGLLALSTTLVIVDKTGKIIVDAGLRPVNETSRSRDLLPVYRGAGKEAVKPENIDLTDPKKKVHRAFSELVDETVTDMLDLLREALK